MQTGEESRDIQYESGHCTQRQNHHAVHAHRYKRDDGLDLTATLYLPPGYDKERDGRLPCILWAYPREFKTKVCLSSAT